MNTNNKIYITGLPPNVKVPGARWRAPCSCISPVILLRGGVSASAA